jgi:lysophospholipid acyltransferase (LPLAT)-like uncharacterized protein
MTSSTSAAVPHELPWSRKVLVAGGAVLLRLLMRSWRIERQEMEAVQGERDAGGAHVLAFWHGRMLGALSAHRYSGIRVLVSEHKDGELIARVLHANGVETIRGSTTRGGARALLQLVAALKQGHTIAITPDGPRGPRHEVAPGLFAAAQRAGAPIVPMAVAASSSWQLGSWDRFEIPKPFARVVVRYGTVLRLPAEATRDVPQLTALFRAALDDAQAAAEAAVRR